jgi:hypothetical protein
MHGSSSRDRLKTKYRPRVEVLEDRTVPAAPPQAAFVPTCSSPGSVVFTANSAASGFAFQLNLIDNGHGGITYTIGQTAFGVTTTGKSTALPAACGPTISRIQYNASTGSDSVTYSMANNVRLEEDMSLVFVLPATGNKGLTVTMGTPFKRFVPGSAGTPAKPPVLAKPVSVDGHLLINFVGSPVQDNATLNYAGQLKGSLRALFADPQRGKHRHPHANEGDKVSFTFNLSPASAGRLLPRIQGGLGDDNLTLLVLGTKKAPRTKLQGAPEINGGKGNNTCFSVPPVSEVNCQS